MLCEHQVENIWHMFLTCSLSVACWESLNIWHLISPLLDTFSSLLEVFSKLLSSLDRDKRIQFVMALWSLWGARNDKLWEGRILSCAQVLLRTSSFFSDWSQARVHGQEQHLVIIDDEDRVTAWRPLDARYVKCNADAAFFMDSGKTSFGMCIRDTRGGFLLAKIDWVPSCLSVRGRGHGASQIYSMG